MAELILAEELQDYLVTQGVGQLPDAAASATVPSIWLAPRDGAPQPRKNENVTITLVDAQLGASNALEAWLEESYVDVIVVARNSGTAKLVHRVIRNLIHPIEAHGGRKQWLMGQLKVEFSTVWRAEQPLAQSDVAYARTASYRFQCRRKALAGTPSTP